MAEQPTDDSQGANPANVAESGAVAPTMMIETQYVKDLSFENPLAPAGVARLQAESSIEVDIKCNVHHLVDNAYEVVLIIRGEAKTEEKSIFIVELSYGGVMTVKGVPEEAVNPMLLIEGPRMLFPFARAIIADATRDGGFPPLLVNPIDFAQLYHDQPRE